MKKADQLLLNLNAEPSLSRDDLIVSSSNVAALSLIDQWPNWAGPYAILNGPAGSGKTHLAQIWCEQSNAHQVDAHAMRDIDLDFAQNGSAILVDGLSPETIDETRMFHLMNAVRNAQSHMLITSVSPIEHWPLKTPDLMSRMKSATNISILTPDDTLLNAVIAKLFADRQIAVPNHVIDYIVQRIERSLEVANQLVTKLDKVALVNKTGITKPLVKQTLDDISVAHDNFDDTSA